MTVREKIYNGLFIASDLRQFLLARPILELRVHSVFETSVNLLTQEEELVTFASSGRDIMPMGMVAAVPGVSVWGLRAGDTLSSDGRLVFNLPRGAGSIWLKDAHVRPVSLTQPLQVKCSPGIMALDLIKTKLLLANADGISPLIAWMPEGDTPPSTRKGNVYCTFIYRDLELFLKVLVSDKPEHALDLTERLIGFGPGLTPSCDDFLAGILLSLFYDSPWGNDANNGLHENLERVAVIARDRTTLVSYHMLRHAASGRANEAYLELLRAIVEDDLDALDSLIERVLAYGSSSGADFLFGLYCARKISADNIRTSRSDSE